MHVREDMKQLKPGDTASTYRLFSNPKRRVAAMATVINLPLIDLSKTLEADHNLFQLTTG